MKLDHKPTNDLPTKHFMSEKPGCNNFFIILKCHNKLNRPMLHIVKILSKRKTVNIFKCLNNDSKYPFFVEIPINLTR